MKAQRGEGTQQGHSRVRMGLDLLIYLSCD